MKKLTFIATFLLGSMLFAQAGNEQRITLEQLPKVAQTTISTYFNGKKIAKVEKETDRSNIEYTVEFSNNDDIKFDKNGDWTEIDGSVPTKLIPTEIQKVVASKYPHKSIIQIEKDKNGYDVELSNGVDLEFDKKYNLKKVDK